MNELLQIPYPEFDYLALMNALRDYRYPRDRVTKLLASGRIVRVKKGLYILGDELRGGPFSREILANLIYGPSYISLEYALSYHQMIPEWVRHIGCFPDGIYKGARRSRRFWRSPRKRPGVPLWSGTTRGLRGRTISRTPSAIPVRSGVKRPGPRPFARGYDRVDDGCGLKI